MKTSKFMTTDSPDPIILDPGFARRLLGRFSASEILAE
jgi:hypothetical protein